MSSAEVEELERLLASATLPVVQAALSALIAKEREKVRPIDDATTAYNFLTNYVLVDKKTIAELYTIEPHADIRKMLILLFCLLNKKRTTIVDDNHNTLISSSITEILKAITFNKLKGRLEFRQFTNTDAPYCEFTGNTITYLDFDNLDTIIDESRVMMFVENRGDEDARDVKPEIYSVTEDVLPSLESFRANILGYAGENNIAPIQEFENQYEGALAKPKLNLQLHQEIIVTGLCNKIAEALAPGGAGAAAAVSTKFLVGVLPRGGKTYIAGGIIREYMKQTLRANPEKSLNIIWFTATPNETKSQVGKDLIEKFQDLDDFVFIAYPFVPSAACATEEVCRSTKKHSVIFCSTQLLVNKSSTGKAFLQGMITNADMFFFDEAHKTGGGEETKAKIKSIIEVKPTVFLTATYYSIIEDYGLTRENTFIWDYTDVKQTRKLGELPEDITGIDDEAAIKAMINENAAVLNLKKRFGEELVEHIILHRIENDETPRAMARDYHNFPNLNFISYDMPPGMIPMKDMFEKAEEENSVRIKELVNIVSRTLEYITVFCHQETTKSRFSFENHDTILMFVPTGINISKVLKTWATALLENDKFTSYEVACILDEGGEDKNTRAMNLFGNDPTLVSKAEESIMKNFKYNKRIHLFQSTKEKDIKQQIQEFENALQKQNKGLIILAGSKLSTGVSLPCTDVVFLLNDDKSEDTVIQKMYRALTPSHRKNETFVVDYNPVRSFAAIYGYTLLASGEEQKFKEGKKNKRSEANKATAAVTEGKIKALLADTYNWHKVGDAGVKTPEQKSAYVDELYAAALKDDDFRCHLNKQLCALPAAAAAGQGGARARRTTLRTTRSKRKISKGRTKHHMKRTN